jgi:hypothetical protein
MLQYIYIATDLREGFETESEVVLIFWLSSSEEGGMENDSCQLGGTSH